MNTSTLKTTLAWLTLCATTLVSVGASGSRSVGELSAVVLAIAAFKVLLVMHYFMEVPQAARLFRLAYYGWLALVLAVLSFLLW
ncbi:MAG: cytochrome C oxidase subunit IV family protein [Pseudomonadota bacterium]